MSSRIVRSIVLGAIVIGGISQSPLFNSDVKAQGLQVSDENTADNDFPGFPTSGVFENNVKWNLNTSTGLLTIGGGTLTKFYDSEAKYDGGRLPNWPWSEFDGPGNYGELVKQVVITGPLNLEGSAPDTFLGNMPNLTQIVGMSNLETSKGTNFNYMFHGDSSLKVLDLSNIDMSAETEEANMLTLNYGGSDIKNNKISKLILGPAIMLGVKKYYDADLASPDGSDKWQSASDSTQVYTPQQLMALYSKDNPNHPTKVETWIPYTKASLNLQKTVEIHTGEKFDPSMAFISATDASGNKQSYQQVLANGLTVNLNRLDTTKAGQYVVEYSYLGRIGTVNVIVTNKPTPAPTPVNNGGEANNASTNTNSNNSAWNSTSSITTNQPAVPNYAAVQGSAVYATKGIYMYKNANFKKNQRIAKYPKAKRVNRPMFVVTGYARSASGTLRYKVRDVNHGKKSANKVGYITASRKYVVNVYYKTMPKNKKITVISKKGVHAYKNANLTGKAKTYKNGKHLRVKKIVKHNLTTRYQLSNGYYVTANKKLVIQGNY
ncbi:DUF5776 domain-containing protein [Lentilactobacillus rapi]|uniref:DUF5776 domain-containing protein n=1 Tax=Lentilactobacillus rapi TaxID=481723 RepID=UPI00138ECB9A|nr:DUF5776 domain-containing protein [Lentilactobacillus rapi]